MSNVNWENWVEENLIWIETIYDIKGYFTDSEIRDECYVFTHVEGRRVSNVGTDHVFNNNEHDDDVVYVQEFLLKAKKRFDDLSK